MDVTLAGSALTRNWSDAELQGISIGLEAFDGQIGSSTVPIPDPAGGDEVPPGSALVIEEGSTLLLSGIVISEGRSRGFEPTDPNKLDSYTVDDPNTFLYGFRVANWIRPEETDYARIAAFFADFLPAVDTTQVLNTSTTTMVAATYDSDGVADIMRDAIDITGKTLFLHDLAAGGICAHWHALTGGHACGLTIDDSDPSVNGPTDWLPQNPSRVRDGTDLANDILAYGSADLLTPVLVQDATSIAAYDVDGKRHQSFAQFPEATDLATLTLDANRLLETNKDPRDTWTCTIGPLDATALANIRVGDIITCTSTVMTLSAEPQRIASMRLSVAGAQRVAPTLWMAELTLGAPVRGPKGRATARPPVLQPAAPSIFNPASSCFADDFNRTVAAGDWDNGWGWSAAISHPTPVPSVNAGVGKVVFGPYGPGPSVSSQILLEVTIPEQTGAFGVTMQFRWTGDADFTGGTTASGSVALIGFKTAAGSFSGSATMRNDGFGFVRAATAFSSTDDDFNSWAPGATYVLRAFYQPGIGCGVTCAGQSVFDANPAAAAGIDTLQIEGLVFDADETSVWNLEVDYIAIDGCTPSTGQQVPLETVAIADGATTDFNTSHRYAPGSLRVLVDRIDWTNEVTETDPESGTFTFDTAPFDSDQIDAYYVAG